MNSPPLSVLTALANSTLGADPTQFLHVVFSFDARPRIDGRALTSIAVDDGQHAQLAPIEKVSATMSMRRTSLMASAIGYVPDPGETVWTLRLALDQDKAAQLSAVRSVLNDSAFAFADREAVGRAVTLFERSSCGFSDCLVAAKHEQLGCAIAPLNR